MSLFAWGIILFLILVNAFYVAAEFAAVGVRRGQVRQLAESGNTVARRLLPILENAQSLDGYIAACQIGITLSSLILGAYGQITIAVDLATLLKDVSTLQPVAAHSIASVSVLVLLTTLQVVFGELVPKSLALQYPTQTAISTYLPMKWSLMFFGGAIAFLNGNGLLIMRLMGLGQVGSHRHIHSPEEIEMLFVESRDGGLLEPEEQRRLHQALQLGRRTARQLMVPRMYVAGIEMNTPPEQVLEAAIESPYTRLPVYRESLDNVVGLLHTKDLAAHFARHGNIPSLKKLMRPMPKVPSTVTADRLLTLLRESRSRQAVVLDEFGGIQGIVTLEDVLSELVGNVADEFKGNHPSPERLPDGRVRLPGMLRLEEAARWTEGVWEHEGVETVGGRVLAELGLIPRGGERVTIDGMEVEVERVDKRAIASVLVTPARVPSDDQATER